MTSPTSILLDTCAGVRNTVGFWSLKRFLESNCCLNKLKLLSVDYIFGLDSLIRIIWLALRSSKKVCISFGRILLSKFVPIIASNRAIDHD